MFSLDLVENYDPEVAEAIKKEIDRQNSHIELIASENFVSKAVMAAMGSPLTNKYAEGYPGKRYYGGCEYVDIVENLAIERAKKLFGCEYVNVQPHSGAQANLAAFFAMVTPGDTVMGMGLPDGGHLTHGSPVNISGKYFNIVPYGVNEEGFIDYDEVLRIAKEAKPKLIVAGASAYPREIDFKKFREIADEVGAYLMVDMAHIAGLVAAGLHMSPIPYADVVTTTTHKTLRGPRGGMILASKEANEKFNFNKAVFPGIQGGPLMHVIAGKAVCLKQALDDSFKVYMQNVKDNAKALDSAVADMEKITGQKAVLTRAKNSVANFKIREGMAIGCKVTLRGEKMYEFVDRLINLALPRVRDFRGVNPNAFDGRGNYALGIKEQLIFPEIEYDKVDKVRGMDVIITTTAKTDEEARELLRMFNMPFKK